MIVGHLLNILLSERLNKLSYLFYPRSNGLRNLKNLYSVKFKNNKSVWAYFTLKAITSQQGVQVLNCRACDICWRNSRMDNYINLKQESIWRQETIWSVWSGNLSQEHSMVKAFLCLVLSVMELMTMLRPWLKLSWLMYLWGDPNIEAVLNLIKSASIILGSSRNPNQLSDSAAGSGGEYIVGLLIKTWMSGIRMEEEQWQSL